MPKCGAMLAGGITGHQLALSQEKSISKREKDQGENSPQEDLPPSCTAGVAAQGPLSSLCQTWSLRRTLGWTGRGDGK